ncbi:hypothetical protein GYMLUDRAFT_242432 [Collybiopsis luxurians FD-317 M1]|uniref:Uncharacterized protein n=1 Tax=Collybiopsis luxurians FD-317 M1 TaxID=944289 RepID=A0A0D0BFU1_9AGAR|nr:hypothetical protein GYMLUDRAFT_242432 [Collybiopsis luxurians FD-317 M1]
MFLLSTAYWMASISTLIQLIQAWFLSPNPDLRSAPNYLPFFNAMVSINYILTDGVVVWRAWVIYSVDGTKALAVCICMLFLTTASAAATIAIRIAMIIINTQTGELFNRLNHGINVTQVGTLLLSVLTNSITTSLILIKAWRNRAESLDNLDATADICARVGRIYTLLIETGILYTLSCLTMLVSSVIPLKDGTLGDLYTPVNSQIAGIYPVAVLLLIIHDQTNNKTTEAFAFRVHRTDIDPSIQQAQLISTMRFDHQSIISLRSCTFEVHRSLPEDSDAPGHTKHDVNSLPPIHSTDISLGDIRESV